MAAVDVLMPVRNGILIPGRIPLKASRGQTFSDWRLLIPGPWLVGRIGGAGKPERGAGPAHTGPADVGCGTSGRPAQCRTGTLRLPLCHAWHDADDIALPDRMALMHEFCTAHKQYVVVGGEALMIDAAGRQIDRLRPPTDPKEITAAGFFYNPIIHPTVTIRFKAFRELGASYGRDFLGILPAADSISL